MTAHYTIGFSTEEKDELLSLLSKSPKWQERVKNANGSLASDNYSVEDFRPAGNYRLIKPSGSLISGYYPV